MMGDEAVKKLLNADIKSWLGQIGDQPFKVAVLGAADALGAKLQMLEAKTQMLEKSHAAQMARSSE